MEDSTNLSGRVVRGGVWVFLVRGVNRILGLVRTLILARLLLPEDFGLIAIALLATATLETFSVTGLDRALIQRSSAGDEFWDTAWLVAVIRGVILCILIFIAAPWVAAFFNRPDGAWVIRVIAFAPLIRGFNNPSVIRYAKDLEFRRVFIYEFGITVADVVVAIPLAIVFRSAWALVAGNLAGQFAGMVISWVVHPHRIRIRFDRKAFGELFRFGRWVAGSAIPNFLLTQGDDIVVGKMLGASGLGLYQMAYRISNLPATEIAQMVSNVTYPAYSKIQENIARVGSAFLRVLRMTTLLSFPLGALVILLGPDFTRVVLGPNWVPMIPAMQILALYGMIHSLGASNGPVFYALGRPDIVTKLQLVKLLILAATIYHLTKYFGMVGTAWAITGNAILTNPIADYLVMRQVEGRIRDFLAALWPAAIITLGMALAVWGMLFIMDEGLVRLLVCGLVAGAVCILGIGILERRGRLDIIAEARAALANRPEKV